MLKYSICTVYVQKIAQFTQFLHNCLREWFYHKDISDEPSLTFIILFSGEYGESVIRARTDEYAWS